MSKPSIRQRNFFLTLLLAVASCGVMWLRTPSKAEPPIVVNEPALGPAFTASLKLTDMPGIEFSRAEHPSETHDKEAEVPQELVVGPTVTAAKMFGISLQRLAKLTDQQLIMDAEREDVVAEIGDSVPRVVLGELNPHLPIGEVKQGRKVRSLAP